ncbi:methyl-CpG-binding domain protein 2-like [Achroia grisella]|uniref:methyl-CpG-binding domain protein 2-like n=1 Tax=Achroia grisella TaxID=688607 RepID=UPI0027D233E2|nr:methyl-CpG-binding domain protein 2-like [Achroia grisella]
MCRTHGGVAGRSGDGGVVRERAGGGGGGGVQARAVGARGRHICVAHTGGGRGAFRRWRSSARARSARRRRRAGAGRGRARPPDMCRTHGGVAGRSGDGGVVRERAGGGGGGGVQARAVGARGRHICVAHTGGSRGVQAMAE